MVPLGTCISWLLILLFLEREKKIFLEHPGVQPDLEGESYVIGRLLRPEARKDIISFFDEQQIMRRR